MDLHMRKHPTICTKNRKCILSQIVGRGFLDAPQNRLSDFGRSVESAITYLSEQSETLRVDKYIIMPNHIHLLIEIYNKGDGGASGKPRPTDAIIPKFVSSLKRYTNKVGGNELWQTGYYDHIIRDENDYLTKWQYMETNPHKWVEDKYYSE